MQKGTSVLFLISPSKYSLCFFEESSSLKLDKKIENASLAKSKEAQCV